mmetsp:Transcript_24791/g.71631  ORF Transcript_24791/g.71631 Transcript_24791/m.71631 type:complete len:251 (-) Transcript_24791:211-963(-)
MGRGPHRDRPRPQAADPQESAGQGGPRRGKPPPRRHVGPAGRQDVPVRPVLPRRLPGRHHRPHPGGREVRSRSRLSLLHLLPVVDQGRNNQVDQSSVQPDPPAAVGAEEDQRHPDQRTSSHGRFGAEADRHRGGGQVRAVPEGAGVLPPFRPGGRVDRSVPHGALRQGQRGVGRFRQEGDADRRPGAGFGPDPRRVGVEANVQGRRAEVGDEVAHPAGAGGHPAKVRPRRRRAPDAQGHQREVRRRPQED